MANLLYWRQLDVTRNSIQMAGQACFTHSQLHGKSCAMIQDMLMLEKGINWNDFDTDKKRGSCCIQLEDEKETGQEHPDEMDEKADLTMKETYGQRVSRPHWVIDREIPIFKGEGREYIEKLVYPEEDE